ncbi:hypothetical protein HED55_22550 [Ochrobactrum haematophilum]|uniref:LysR substrate-binding domain-containing protein n=1 Tax=Brucella haematophila TaxID=419474 RepID=A0ABX1DPS2_9HYPH|nr:hypothetical protein [Brucella haematophila]
MPLAETVQTEMPSIRMHLTEAMSRIILEKIDREDVHIGCVYETPDPSQFVTQPLYTEELFLCTAPDNWPGEIGSNGVALQPVPVDVLEKLPLVMPNNSHGGRTVAEKYARSFNTSLNVVMEIDPLPSLIEMACRASAYTILSEAAVMHHVNAGTLALVPIEGVKMERTAYLVRKRSRPMSRAAFWVQNMIISITEEMIQRYKLSARLHPARENSETA